MKPFPEAILSTDIAIAVAAVIAAKNALSKVLTAEQSKCDHRFVSEAPYKSGGLPAMRICNHCRLIEEGSHWSGGATWSQHDYGKSALGNVAGRIVTPIDRDAFYDMRVAA